MWNVLAGMCLDCAWSGLHLLALAGLAGLAWADWAWLCLPALAWTGWDGWACLYLLGLACLGWAAWSFLLFFPGFVLIRSRLWKQNEIWPPKTLGSSTRWLRLLSSSQRWGYTLPFGTKFGPRWQCMKFNSPNMHLLWKQNHIIPRKVIHRISEGFCRIRFRLWKQNEIGPPESYP